MDFKHATDKPEKQMTPKSKVSIFSKRISSGVKAPESPFRSMPNFSTPPSRFAKIMNPFEKHLIDQLHLPVFSPNVFAQKSTPKETKFKWTIDDISSLRPADIDEATISQHVFSTEDPQTESLVQQKINTFFSKKEIVPSPMNEAVKSVPLIKDCTRFLDTSEKSSSSPKQYCNGTTQTILTLPPMLPKEVEDALKPYFTFTEDQQQSNLNGDSVLYRQLFEFDDNAQMPDQAQSCLSSPALSTGFSPLQLSPLAKGLSSPINIPELRDCTLSPIACYSPARLSKSACRLDFSSKTSMDISIIVPDVDNQQMSVLCSNDCSISPIKPTEVSNDTSDNNWSMEYKQVSEVLPASLMIDSDDKMDVSNSNTPHSKIFTSQRKRLSDSFRHNEIEFEKENVPPCIDNASQGRNKMSRNDLTDVGYYTGAYSVELSNCTNVFASTPSKRKNN